MSQNFGKKLPLLAS